MKYQTAKELLDEYLSGGEVLLDNIDDERGRLALSEVMSNVPQAAGRSCRDAIDGYLEAMHAHKARQVEFTNRIDTSSLSKWVDMLNCFTTDVKMDTLSAILAVQSIMTFAKMLDYTE
jgi:hypothetical protein